MYDYAIKLWCCVLQHKHCVFIIANVYKHLMEFNILLEKLLCSHFDAKVCKVYMEHPIPIHERHPII